MNESDVPSEAPQSSGGESHEPDDSAPPPPPAEDSGGGTPTGTSAAPPGEGARPSSTPAPEGGAEGSGGGATGDDRGGATGDDPGESAPPPAEADDTSPEVAPAPRVAEGDPPTSDGTTSGAPESAGTAPPEGTPEPQGGSEPNSESEPDGGSGAAGEAEPEGESGTAGEADGAAEAPTAPESGQESGAQEADADESAPVPPEADDSAEEAPVSPEAEGGDGASAAADAGGTEAAPVPAEATEGDADSDAPQGAIDNPDEADANEEIDNTLDRLNPQYDSGESAYSENCTGVVQAYELQRRGVDAQPGPLEQHLRTDEGGPGGRSLDAIERPWGGSFFPGDRQEIEAAFADPGARGTVYIAWDGGGAHVFCVENVDGDVRFIDAQPDPPVTDASQYFDHGGDTAYLRLDNRPTPKPELTKPYLEN